MSTRALRHETLVPATPVGALPLPSPVPLMPKSGGVQNNPPTSDVTIPRLVGVYNASGTLTGELAYLVGARFGRAHCALCDITHGRVRARPEWRVCQGGLPVPFDTHHHNDQPDQVRRAYDIAPVVLADTGNGLVVLLGPHELPRCGGSTERLVEEIETAIIDRSLAWPS